MSHTDVTPYRAAQIATAVLRASGQLDADQEVAPQTMYGLARPGKTSGVSAILTTTHDGEGDKIYFVGDAFAEWLNAAKSGNGRGRVAVNMQTLIAEYSDVSDDETDEQDDDEQDPEVELNEADHAEIAADEAELELEELGSSTPQA